MIIEVNLEDAVKADLGTVFARFFSSVLGVFFKPKKCDEAVFLGVFLCRDEEILPANSSLPVTGILERTSSSFLPGSTLVNVSISPK